MAHSDRHLFVHLPHSRRAPGAIRAAEVPALHFHRYLGGCLVRVRGGKVVTNQTGRGSLTDAGAGMQISAPEQRNTHHGLLSPHICASEGFRTAPQPIHSSNFLFFFYTSCDGGGCVPRRWIYPDLV